MQSINTLLSVLEDERQSILAGDLHALPKLADAKIAVLSRLKQSSLTQDQLTQIQSMTARNQSLLASAADGIRAVRKRLEAIRTPVHGVKTYTRTGASKVLSHTHSSFEKRA